MNLTKLLILMLLLVCEVGFCVRSGRCRCRVGRIVGGLMWFSVRRLSMWNRWLVGVDVAPGVVAGAGIGGQSET